MSQSDSVTVTVDEHSYDCFKLDPWVMNEITHRILNTLGQTAGEIVLALLSGDKGDEPIAVTADTASLSGLLGKKLNPEHLAKGLSQALQNLSADDSRWLMEHLAQKTTITGGGKLSAEWSAHFLGRPVAMYRWAIAALRSQYDFLE